MKTSFNFDLAGFEMTKGDQKITLNDGSKMNINIEYDPSEVLEYIKSLPQIVSVVKDAVNDVIKSAVEFGKAEAAERRETSKLRAEIETNERQQKSDIRIKEADADAAREGRVRRTSPMPDED